MSMTRTEAAPAARAVAARPTLIAQLLSRRESWASLLFLFIFLAAWEWLPGALGMPEFIIPPLSKVVVEFVRMLGTERLLFHTGV
ncbi:MAG: ABC transporter permease, partial [Candidatus Eiseniibacteriota bacterium]